MAKTKTDDQAGEPKEKGRIRRRITQRTMRIGFLRRRYVKRVIKYIDKSKEKGRRLPPEMMELSRFLSRVPKHERAERLDEALVAQQDVDRSGETAFNRDLRRAAANQQRRSGKNPAGYRPGMPPKSQQIGRRPSKPR